MLNDFPLRSGVEISKIKPSDLSGWLESHRFKYSSYNHYIQVLKALFEVAVTDKALADSPARTLKVKKVVTPRRVTPSYEEFRVIIADVRSQKGNADAEESADFLEFLGLLGVGQAETSGIAKQHVNLSKQQLTFFRVKTCKPYFIPIFPQARALVLKRYEKALEQTDPLFRSISPRAEIKRPALGETQRKPYSPPATD
ncbi:MAG: hypothetical protein ABIT76_00085 [Chthoniobacterales bacterium]